MRDWNLKSSRETKSLKKISYVIITAIAVQNLCGCSPLQKMQDALTKTDVIESETGDEVGSGENKSPVGGGIKVIDINGDVHETSVNVIDEGEAEDNAAEALPARNLAQVAQNLTRSGENDFAYSELTDSCRTCYLEIYAILSDLLEKVDLTSKDPDEIDLAFRAVMVDHPEIFYVKGYSIGKYMSGDVLKKIVFSGTYTMSKEEVEKGRQETDEYVSRVISGYSGDGSDYDRIKYVYDYLIRNNEYVPESINNQNILSVVENGQTVCQGYTKAMQLILNKMGIFCTLVNGTACGSGGVPNPEDLADVENAEWGGHVWNIVRCNGMYYNVDVTWGDAAITLMNADGMTSDNIDVNYEFFLVDDVSLDETHKPEPVVTMPRCNSMEDNYYIHEGLYFTGVDPDGFHRAFESSLASGQRIMFIKASSPEAFGEIRRHLFDEQNVFEYLGRSNVRYVEFAERNLIMISL